ncbi:MAG: hypothetical protein WBP08_01925 [Saprospiraceae bacterium]|jgi:hypothetical protein|nr:hypothetical protein [Saprospiraceae bacterium]
MIDKNSFVFGLLLGCVVPVIGFVVVEFLFNQLTSFGLIDEVSSSTSGRRFRTLTLIAICTVLVPFNIAISKKWDQTSRGIIFPTLIYAGAWVYKFYTEITG